MGKYLLGKPEDFYEFVERISKKDKIGIVSHTDMDGIDSAINLQTILESKGLKIKFIEFLNYGFDALKPILKKGYNKLFFTDWNVDTYSEYLTKLREKGEVFVIDHHPLDNKLEDKSRIIKTDSNYCSSHCTFDLAKKYVDTKNLEKLTCAAMILDYVWDKSDENFEFIQKVFHELKKDNSIWNSEPGKLGEIINGALIYYHPNYKKVYNLIRKNKFSKLERANKVIAKEVTNYIDKFQKEAEHFSDKKLYFYYAKPKYNITSTVSNLLSSKYFPSDTLVFVSDTNDQKGFVNINARNQTGKINLNELLKKSISGFENATAGGHTRASGGRFPKRYLDKFKENLLREL